MEGEEENCQKTRSEIDGEQVERKRRRRRREEEREMFNSFSAEAEEVQMDEFVTVEATGQVIKVAEAQDQPIQVE